jgi:pilus assembly protein CpaE
MSDTTSFGSDESELIAPLPRVSIQAFCEGMDFGQVMSEVVEDRRFTKTHTKVQMGGVPAAIEAYRSSPTPNVLVIEIHGPAERIMAQLTSLSDVCEPDTRVVVVGEVNDIHLYRALMSHGLSDYLTLPLTAIDLVRSLSALFSASQTKAVGRLVSFIGARGGVGSSTIAHNVAYAVAHELETETCIADLDVAFGTAGLNFNQDPVQGVAEAVAAPERLDASMLDRLLSPCSDKLSLLAAAALLEQTYDYLPDQFNQLIDTLRTTVPVAVVDLPHVWTAWSRKVLASSDDIVIVLTPDLASLRNTRNLLDALKALRPNDTAPICVLNMVGMPKRPEIKEAELSKALGHPRIISLPFDPYVFGAAANNGQMIAEVDAAHAVNAEFLSLAETLLGRTAQKKRKSSMNGLFDQIAPMIDAISALRKKVG